MNEGFWFIFNLIASLSITAGIIRLYCTKTIPDDFIIDILMINPKVVMFFCWLVTIIALALSVTVSKYYFTVSLMGYFTFYMTYKKVTES